MNFCPLSREVPISLITVLLLVSFCAAGSWVFSYDSPDFDYELFSPDGLLLEKNDRNSLLQALAALASNFPDNKQIDSDLKEKALALALKIDPLHQTSRMAHDALMKGKKPPKTAYFTKVSAISQELWSVAEKMLAGSPEPEAAKLAPWLMDLSLTLYPTPPPDHLKQFAKLTNFQLLPWQKFVTLQPKENPSSLKMGLWFSLLKMEKPLHPVTPPPKADASATPPPRGSDKRGVLHAPGLPRWKIASL